MALIFSNRSEAGISSIRFSSSGDPKIMMSLSFASVRIFSANWGLIFPSVHRIIV